MQMEADATAFWAAVREVDGILARLNSDGAFTGFVALFDRLIADLPSDFFECEIVPTRGVPAENVLPVLAVLRPGSRLNAIAAALRALEFNEHEAPPQDRETLSRVRASVESFASERAYAPTA